MEGTRGAVRVNAMFGALLFTFLKMPNPNIPYWTSGWTTTLNIYAQVGLVTLVGLILGLLALVPWALAIGARQPELARNELDRKALMRAIRKPYFVPEGTAWAHLDIAGPFIVEKQWKYYTEGATGFLVPPRDAENAAGCVVELLADPEARDWDRY